LDLSSAPSWYNIIVAGDLGTVVAVDHHGDIQVDWDDETKRPFKLVGGDAFDWIGWIV
jgi:hypothetical protein